MLEELKHHGYRIGPGTIYPLLHGMERGGLLKSEFRNVNGRRRRSTGLPPPGSEHWTRPEKKSMNYTTSFTKNSPERYRY
jgi:hypothetical protein